EFVDNVRVVMFAGHDTTSVLLTFMIRHLANDPVVYAEILKAKCDFVEQEEIATSKKSSEELLTWG
ncbi:hypothetical protein FRX31_018773, partial [Thalictrum thalictroides]